jgi:predicted nucleotidyltransferase
LDPLVGSRLSQIRELCTRFGVKWLSLFGSAVKGSFNKESSDLDFLVEFSQMSGHQHADSYFGLLFALEDLFERKIDLVEYGAIDNEYFLRSVDQNKVELFAA